MVAEKVVKSKKPQKYAKNGRFITPQKAFFKIIDTRTNRTDLIGPPEKF